MAEQQRYPLAWPTGWKRTQGHERKRARFHGTTRKYSSTGAGSWTEKHDLSVDAATRRLILELKRLGAEEGDWVLSSNLRVRLDGFPHSKQANPDDPGVAVYFRVSGKDRVLACDTWDRTSDNIAAIAAHISAIRAVDRYGGTCGITTPTSLPRRWRSTRLSVSPLKLASTRQSLSIAA